jgi:CRP/FNR family cyclic AMP-dependent transcriptional regulator
MDLKPPSEAKAGIKQLIAACMQNDSEPALGQHIKTPQWDLLEAYLQPMALAPAQALITKGSNDRAVYFVASGSLTVHREDAAGKVRLAIVSPGAAVGEGSFFSHQPRKATVQASGETQVWVLTPIRFTEMCNRQPAAALAVSMALAGLLASRAADKRKRISIT